LIKAEDESASKRFAGGIIAFFGRQKKMDDLTIIHYKFFLKIIWAKLIMAKLIPITI